MTVLGRKDRQIQIRGMRVEPFEIEVALRGCPSVVDAAVMSRETAGETSLTAFVVLAGPDNDADRIAGVKQHLARSLPSHMRPSRVIPLERLPLLPGYKIDTEALRALSIPPDQASRRSDPDYSVGDSADAAVRQAWCRMLGADSFAQDATFADAGGDSLNLLRLILDIERQLGIALPLANFDHDMTPSDVARVVSAALDAAPGGALPSEVSPAVLLKSGAGQPPVFIAPGLGGHAAELTAIGKYLAGGRPVYALQATGFTGDAAVPAEIEAFATRYVAAITEIQPSGPYVLVGYSLGGLIMLEAALMLRAQSAEIVLLAMLETYPHPRFWPMRPWLEMVVKQGRHAIAAMRRMRRGDILPYAMMQAASLVRHSTARMGQTPKRPNERRYGRWPDDIRCDLAAAKAVYRVRRYDGRIVFFQPQTRHWGLPDDPVCVWRKFADQLEIVSVPGDHSTMCTTHADALSSALDRCIEKALARD
jgi:thioesterase domain-containing protein/acyl carrier protein